jgi:hypothetical protein
MQLAFGAGALWGERTDQTGSGIGPQQFGVMQDVTIDFAWQTKELYGQFQFPVAIARGQGKVTGKARLARILGRLYSDLFWGTAPMTGQLTVSELEAATVPAATPFAVTVANATNFYDDLGVFYAMTGLPFSRVTTPTVAGQYSVASNGVYTFDSADAGAELQISYTYNSAAAGTKITLANQLTGTTPIFKATFYTLFQSQPLALRLNQCVASKLTLPTKVDDFTIHEFDFDSFADASGTVGYFSTAQ